ncbi:cytochrome P450 [Streptomyces sp. NPDC020965]|uniref:cytochrome P450 n=1 Tax=Streptomyces sp. NPDC020965 TaxID=3365105 RepID=UPI0037B4FAD2
MTQLPPFPTTTAHGRRAIDLRTFGDALHRDPYSVYARLLAEGPIHWAVQPDSTPTWLILGYEEVKEALSHPDLSSDPANATPAWRTRYLLSADTTQLPQGRILLTSDPPDHTRLRKPIAQAFTARRSRDMRPMVEEATKRLVDALPDTAPFDAVEDFAAPLALTVICNILGINEADQARLRTWTHLITFATDVKEAFAARHQLIPYADQLVADKRTCPGTDLLSALLGCADADLLSASELRATVIALFGGGHETSIGLLSNALLCLLTHPDQLALLRADPALIDQAIDETLRYLPPVLNTKQRFAQRDVVIGDTAIPGDGTQVIIGLISALHDPRQFPDPHTFDLRRPAGERLPFGHGIHFCPGWALARLEAAVSLPALLTRFPDLTLAVDPTDLVWNPGPIRTLSSLPLLSQPPSSPLL